MATSTPPEGAVAPEPAEEEKDRTALWAATSGVLLLVFVLLLVVLWRLVGGGGGGGGVAAPTLEIANVVDKPVGEATITLQQQGFTVQTTDGADPNKPNDVVLSQDPAGGTKVAEHTAVKLVVNRGSTKVEVPRVLNLPQADATKALADAGLVANVVLQKNPAVTAGLVFAQSPDPKTQVDKGSKVSITVSTGEGLAPIPDVTGLPQDEAMRRLTEAGYAPKAKTELSVTVPAGNVTRTDPPAGTTPAKGATSVTVYVSEGAPTTTLGKATVPNVVGMTEENAKSTIESAGFVVQVNHTTGGTAGRVKAQSPSGGTKATQGSTVVITVTTGSSTSTTGDSTTTTTSVSTTTTRPPTSSTSTTLHI